MAIAKRIQQVITYFEMSASAFADEIGVPRSSISHILSGRNKPSLDFVIKMVNAFPQVNLYWLLNGKGSFPSPTDDGAPIHNAASEIRQQLDTASKRISNADANTTTKRIPPKQIDKVLIFYTDGTFESFIEKSYGLG